VKEKEESISRLLIKEKVIGNNGGLLKTKRIIVKHVVKPMTHWLYQLLTDLVLLWDQSLIEL